MFEFNQSVYYGDWGFPVLPLVRKNVCKLIGLEECNICHIDS